LSRFFIFSGVDEYLEGTFSLFFLSLPIESKKPGQTKQQSNGKQ